MVQTTPQEGETTAVSREGRKTALMGALWKRLWGCDTAQGERGFAVRRGKSPLEGSSRQVSILLGWDWGGFSWRGRAWSTQFLTCRESNRCHQGGEKFQETGPVRKAEVVKP